VEKKKRFLRTTKETMNPVAKEELKTVIAHPHIGSDRAEVSFRDHQLP
jgi:hypothetical protein